MLWGEVIFPLNGRFKGDFVTVLSSYVIVLELKFIFMKKTAFLLLALSMVGFTKKEETLSINKINHLLKEQFAFIPSGLTFVKGQKTAVKSFIISKTVITNKEYRAFLDDLAAQENKVQLEQAKIHAENWKKIGISGKKMAEMYASHPAFDDFPVVNITSKGAELYCNWLSEKLNESLPAGQKIHFRLPTKAEWNRVTFGEDTTQIYAWKGNRLEDDKGRYKANFSPIGEAAIARDNEGNFIVVKDALNPSYKMKQHLNMICVSTMYSPNHFGLYNLNGNVAELLYNGKEAVGGSWMSTGYDIRNKSVQAFHGASIDVGFRVVAVIDEVKQHWYKH